MKTSFKGLSLALILFMFLFYDQIEMLLTSFAQCN